MLSVYCHGGTHDIAAGFLKGGKTVRECARGRIFNLILEVTSITFATFYSLEGSDLVEFILKGKGSYKGMNNRK